MCKSLAKQAQSADLDLTQTAVWRISLQVPQKNSQLKQQTKKKEFLFDILTKFQLVFGRQCCIVFMAVTAEYSVSTIKYTTLWVDELFTVAFLSNHHILFPFLWSKLLLASERSLKSFISFKRFHYLNARSTSRYLMKSKAQLWQPSLKTAHI